MSLPQYSIYTPFSRASGVEFLAMGSRGGFEFKTEKGWVELFPANGEAEVELHQYALYVKACGAENLDALGLTMWRIEKPMGPV